MTRKAERNKNTKKKAGSFSTAFLHVLGTVLLFIIFLMVMLLLLPGLLGLKNYYVVSGSMEPQIPVGSMVYVISADPDELNEGDIIAFDSNGTTVTHRIVKNDHENEEISTKGDRNAVEDLQMVQYEDVIGKVIWHLPYFGIAGSFLSTIEGRVLLMAVGSIGLLLRAYTDH